MTLAATNAAPRLIGDKTRQLAQIEATEVLAEQLLSDLDNLVIRNSGHIPSNHKPIVLESICALNTALVTLYELLGD